MSVKVWKPGALSLQLGPACLLSRFCHLVRHPACRFFEARAVQKVQVAMTSPFRACWFTMKVTPTFTEKLINSTCYDLHFSQHIHWIHVQLFTSCERPSMSSTDSGFQSFLGAMRDAEGRHVFSSEHIFANVSQICWRVFAIGALTSKIRVYAGICCMLLLVYFKFCPDCGFYIDWLNHEWLECLGTCHLWTKS